MQRRLYICSVCIGLGVAICLSGRLAMATLGETAESVMSDRKALSAVQHTSITRNGYTIQEVESKANIVREYISPSGIVFAVA